MFAGICLIFMASNTWGLTLFKDKPKVQTAAVVVHSVKPSELFIPKISKTLNISDGQYVNNQWTISKTGVSYLVDSAAVGSAGNAVVYGHNLPDILGKLKELENGDFVYVLMDDGQFYKYRIVETKAVTPEHVEILRNTSDARLTIYTCTGFLDSARFVVVGELVHS